MPYIELLTKPTGHKLFLWVWQKGTCWQRYAKREKHGKTKWLIDEEAAANIRRIYQMTIEGMGPHQIARQFDSEKIYCPGHKYHDYRSYTNIPFWR